MADFEIRVKVVGDGIAVFNWEAAVPADVLTQAVSAAADDALLGRELRRLEVSLPADDRVARHAVMRAGFRQEGIRRQAWRRPDGSLSDVYLYARLTSDQVHGPNGFSGVMNSTLPKKRAIAHVLIRDERQRILLCDTHFKKDWELPGGVAEIGEAPRVAANRELAEELGVDLSVGQLLAIDWMPPYLGWEDALEFIFDGGVVSAEQIGRFVLQASEIKSIQFCTLAEAADHLTDLSLRRLTHAASLTQGMVYLENGRIPPI